jgi:hypothetical protein
MINDKNKPNFELWSQETLWRVAHELWDVNMQLREDNKDLHKELRSLLRRQAAWEWQPEPEHPSFGFTKEQNEPNKKQV